MSHHPFQVGGKRRLTVPANMAFGDEGALPDIPPKAIVVFDLECKYVEMASQPPPSPPPSSAKKLAREMGPALKRRV